MSTLKRTGLFAALGLVSLVLALGVRTWYAKPAWLVNWLAPKPIEQTKVFKKFKNEIYPLLTRNGQDSCVSCHDEDAKTPLKFFANVTNDFKVLLDDGYFAMEGADTLLGRIITENPKKRMPKGKSVHPWTADEVQTLKGFLGELNKYVKIDGKSDELFPAALTTAYNGNVDASLDNQFITYRQLKGKIKIIFDDDWVRDGRDRFQENLALFGGADFKERFNETAKASSSFLTGLDMLSRDVAARAYTQKTGPFAGRPDSLPSPEKLTKPDGAYEKEIKRVYESVLFRAPTAEEMKKSFALLQTVYRSRAEIQESDLEVSFKLTVQDEATKLTTTKAITMPVSGEYLGFYQELIDESKAGSDKEKIAKQKLARRFAFKAGDAGQYMRLNNVNTIGNVSFHSLELQKVGGTNKTTIAVTDPAVQADGAWKIRTVSGQTIFEDDNQDKGASSIVVPINVTDAGQYEITVCWERNSDNANSVLVEVLSADNSAAVTKPPLPKVPPRGEAHFFYDSSADTVEYAEFKGAFQFGAGDFVEINNKGTRNRVTASAVRFAQNQSTNNGFLVTGKEAEGYDKSKWQDFDTGRFKAYNQQGKTPVSDNNSKKGEAYLRFKPATKKDTFKPNDFYQVQVAYPAKAGNEVRTPVIVKAQKSSPIVQLAYPARARGDAAVEIDASSTYTVQGSKLKFTWQQTGGPWVDISKTKNGPVLKFTAPRRNVQQAAWEALTRALIRHPDFVFTRPPSIQQTKNRNEKERLQLEKIALDLVGRAPNKTEFDQLAKGATLPHMIDGYLGTQEFKDFYFHRIRLYLESQGTEAQDEPARLWCYVAFNDRPFQEILTADYTVDKKMEKQARPAYFGKTGVLTTKGFIEGKPGLPHYNYPAQVSMLFLGYVFEVPPEVIEMREGITASGTTDPSSLCYTCHKLLTPLAMQRQHWDDDGKFRTHDEYGLPIDASDNQLVDGYPFAGEGLEAFATQAVKKERFIRTIINTHFTFFYGREMRYREDERFLYRKLWDELQKDNYKIRTLIKTIMTSPEYLEGKPQLRPTIQQASAVKQTAAVK